MSMTDRIAQKARDLPPEKQKEVLDFVEFLRACRNDPRPLFSAYGLCQDMGVDIGEEEIAEARREMWGNFPRAEI